MPIAKETIVLVHGTWAAPQGGMRHWYEPSTSETPSFVSKLHTALVRLGSHARCWAHCGHAADYFVWSGENSWLDRAAAAARLRKHIRKLTGEGWRCHIVAHSHGGNIVAEALAGLTRLEADALGNVVLAGTPFLDTSSPIRKRRLRSRWWNLVSPVMLYVVVLYLATVIIDKVWLDFGFDTFGLEQFFNSIWISFGLHFFGLWDLADYRKAALAAILAILLVPTVALLLGGLRFLRQLRARKGSVEAASKKTLVYNTPLDEAYLLLRHVERAPNPLDPGATLSAYLGNLRTRYLRQRMELERQSGAPLFSDLSRSWQAATVINVFVGFLLPILFVSYVGIWRDLPGLLATTTFGLIYFVWVVLITAGALWLGLTFVQALVLPQRWLRRRARFLMALPKEIVAFIARKRIWDVFKQMVFGLEAYPYPPPTVQLIPQNLSAAHCRCESLPDQVVERVAQRRDTGITQHFRSLTNLFSGEDVTMKDVANTLSRIERDVTLLHAAYYTEDECIERIAAWIAKGD